MADLRGGFGGSSPPGNGDHNFFFAYFQDTVNFTCAPWSMHVLKQSTSHYRGHFSLSILGWFDPVLWGVALDFYVVDYVCRYWTLAWPLQLKYCRASEAIAMLQFFKHFSMSPLPNPSIMNGKTPSKLDWHLGTRATSIFFSISLRRKGHISCIYQVENKPTEFPAMPNKKSFVKI